MSSFLESIPTFRRLFRFLWRLVLLLFSPRVLSRVAFAVAIPLTLAAIFYTVEKRRWKTAWNEYATQARSRGIRLEVTDFSYTPIPDAQNFAAIPYFRDFYRTPEPPDGFAGPVFGTLLGKTGIIAGRFAATSASDAVRKTVATSAPPTRRTSYEPLDLGNLASGPTTDSAKTILKLLDDECGNVTRQLHEANGRPYCQFVANWNTPERINSKRPYLRQRKAAQLLGMRVTLQSAAHDGPAAFEDLRACLRVADATKDEPFLTSAMIRVAIQALATEAIWTGLSEQIWDDPTLARIDEHLANIDLVTAYHFAIETERAYDNALFGQIANGQFDLFSQPGAAWYRAAAIRNAAFPVGWVYRNQLKMNQWFDESLARIDLAQRTLALQRQAEEEREVNASNHIQDVLFRLMAPSLVRAASRTAITESLVRQARAACALERYRLKHGIYPERLDALIAERFLPSLPRDPVDNAPMNYERTEDGRYALRSVEADRRARENDVISPDWPIAWIPAIAGGKSDSAK